MKVLKKTIEQLQKESMTNKSILVSYSGGKDSLVVLDLCCSVFKHVVCFFMYFIPGLEVCERQLRFAKERWGVEIIQYPHWLLSRVLKNGIYCNNYYKLDDLPELGPNDIYAVARADTGIELIATGQKRSDTLHRRRNLSSPQRNVIHPIKDWNKHEVLAYLRMRNIPVPDSSGAAVTGIDLSTKNLLWLYDNHPEDFKKLCKVFPYAETVVWRRAWYGVDR